MSGDVLCFSHLRWGFVFQRPNHLMSRCARERRVFFIEEPFFDEELPRLESLPTEHGVTVVVPHLPPGTEPQDAERMQRTLFDAFVADNHVRDAVVWLYTAMALPISEHLRRTVTVYDCMDELSGFHGAPSVLREREQALFAAADLVFTGGQSLYEAKRAHHPSVHAFPSSVDAEHFRQARSATAADDPPDQRDIPHPRLGFFGVIDERLDLELLGGAAELRPDLHFVVLGPVVKIDAALLPQRPNIHYLGGKKYAELPAYLGGWDVAIMPFALNAATRYISPTKTLEYLAAGKPVVSTAIHDVVKPYGDAELVRIAANAEEFVAAAQAALDECGTPHGEKRRQACDAFVATTSWDRTWARLGALIRDAASTRKTRPATIDGMHNGLEGASCSTISS